MPLMLPRTTRNGLRHWCKILRPSLRPSSIISESASTSGDNYCSASTCTSPSRATRGCHTTQQLWKHHHHHNQQQQQQEGHLLAHEWIVDGKITSSRGGQQSKEREVIVFLHGLLGNAKNLRTPAKIFTRRLPQYDALLLDLRGHGGSSSSLLSQSMRHSPRVEFSSSSSNNNKSFLFTRPHSIQSCVQDVISTLSHLGLHGQDDSPSVICGHSLGGRIALQYAHSLLHSAVNNTTPSSSDSSLIQPPKQTWILDSVPGVADPSVSKVLSAISSLSTTMTSSSSSSSSTSSSFGIIPTKIKSQITTQLVDEYGLDIQVATWIVSSLRGVDEQSQRPIWAFDIDIALELVQNFTEQDVVAMIRESIRAASSTSTTNNNDNLSHTVQLVMAGKNESWTEPIISELQTIQSSFHGRPSSSSSFKMHTLDKAGHWVHVDDLDGLMKLMVDELG